MKTHSYPKIIVSLLTALIAGVALFALFAPQASASSDCPLTFDEPADLFVYAQNGTLEFSEFSKQDGQATITVTNNSDCDLPLALGSYEMMSGNQLSEQTLHDEQTRVVSAQDSRTLKVDLPSCMSQIDLYHDPNENGVPTPPEPANANLIGFTFSGNEKDVFAENDMFHFNDGHPYENLDRFPNDDDDGYRNAKPSQNSRYCDEPPTEEPATCPLDESDGTVVTFGGSRIRSDQSADDARTDLANIDLSAGTYNITLYGFDQNSNRDNQSQPNESYFLSLQNSGTEIAQTPELGDLADNQLSAERTKTIKDFSVSDDITAVRGMHAVYPDKSSANSLNASCAAFEKQEESEPETPTCPFTEGQEDGEYDKVITFDNSRLRSDKGSDRAKTEVVPVNFSAGSYEIGMFSYDQYEGRRNENQSNEQYFVRLSTTDGDILTDSTPDLRDDSDTATTTKIVTVESGQAITGLQARHSAFFGKTGDDGTPNSHNTGCVAIDKKDTPDPLAGSCSVAPDNPEVNEQVTWSSSASGGTGNYSFSWEGNASGNNQTVTRSYSSTGQKTATVQISDGDSTIERTCRVSVSDDDDSGGGNGGGSGGGGGILNPRNDDDDDDDGRVRGRQDEEFSVQCEPEKDSYLIGEQVTFNADISGDIDEDDVSFDWENGSNLTTDESEARVQYVSAGTKSITVTAKYDDREETDTCRVSVRQAANQSGVRLDQIPYTGPGDTARTVAFGLLVLLIALSASYVGLHRFRQDAVPVGIPEDGKRK